MGKPGWEDETWTPGQSSRGSRADNPDRSERNPGRPYDRERTGRGDPDPRSYERTERQRPARREDEWRGSSSGRSGGAGARRPGDERGSSSDFDRSGRNRSHGREDYADYDSHSGRGSRDYRGGGGRDPRRPGYDAKDERIDERGLRGQRPPTRGTPDMWSPPRGSSAARNRPPDGRLPGAENNPGVRPNRPRPGSSVATEMSGYGAGGRQSLDELRARRLRQQGVETDLAEESSGFSAGKAFLVILLMLLLGSGGAYAYFKVTTPAVHSDGGTPSSGPGAISGGFVPYLPAAESRS
ncbi:MAG: hypothetical protein ACLQUY_03215 [Ktedonobacterales bacterium]